MAGIKKSEEVMGAICDRLAAGRSLQSICKDEDMPARQTVLEWLANDDDFAAQYARAREEQADHYADEIVAIADEDPGLIVTREGERVEVSVDSAAVARQRLRIDSRKWVASKLKPKKYGERTEIEHSGNVVLTPNMNLIVEAMNGKIHVETDPAGVDGRKPD